MVLTVAAIVEMTLLELMMCYTMCVVLAPRAPRLFVSTILALWFVRMIMQIEGINRGRGVVVLLTLHSIVLPLLFSKRSLPRRVMGLSAILAAMTIVELVAEALYRISSGEGAVFPENYSLESYGSLAWIYTAMIAVAAPLFELIKTLFRRLDNDGDITLEWPVTAFLVLSIVATTYWTIRSSLLNRTFEAPVLVTLALIAVQQVIGMALTAVARGDARAQREAARRLVLARQLHHLGELVEQSTERVMAMRHLRHDLANQVDVVRSLAAQGRQDEADRHLAQLQQAAHELAGDLDA